MDRQTGLPKVDGTGVAMNQNCGTAELAPDNTATELVSAGRAGRTGRAGSMARAWGSPGGAPDLPATPRPPAGLLKANPLPARSAHRARLSGLPALLLLSSLIVSMLAGSAAPTPLYAVYQRQWGFSPITITVVFGIYAVAVLASLLVTGRLSDYAGRRPGPPWRPRRAGRRHAGRLRRGERGFPELTRSPGDPGSAMTGAALGAIGAGPARRRARSAARWPTRCLPASGPVAARCCRRCSCSSFRPPPT